MGEIACTYFSCRQSGGHLARHVRKSASLSDLLFLGGGEGTDEVDGDDAGMDSDLETTKQRLRRRRRTLGGDGRFPSEGDFESKIEPLGGK